MQGGVSGAVAASMFWCQINGNPCKHNILHPATTARGGLGSCAEMQDRLCVLASAVYQKREQDVPHVLLALPAVVHTLAMAEPSALLTAWRAMLTGRHTLRPRPSGRTSSCRNLQGTWGHVVGQHILQRLRLLLLWVMPCKMSSWRHEQGRSSGSSILGCGCLVMLRYHGAV